MRQPSLTIVGLVVSLAVALPVQARRKRAPTARNIEMAIFPVATTPKTDAALAGAFDEAVGAAVAEAKLEAIAGAQLSKRLKLGSRVAIERCKGDLDCIAKLGKRLHTNEVLFGSAMPRALGGIEVVIVAVTSADASVARKRTLEIGSQEEIQSVLAGSFAEIFRSDPPASLAGAGGAPVGDGVDELALEPLPELAALPTEMPPAEEPTDSPKSAGAGEEIPLESVLAAGATATTTAATPVPDPNAPKPTAPERTSYLFYSGVGLTGLGAVALAGGSFFGFQSRQHGGEADDKSVPQVDAADLGKRANDEADRANLLFVSAGILGVAGGVLIVLDALVFSGETSASVSVTPNAASAALTVKF